MNFSAEKARRKWPCGGLACGEWPMVTAAAALLVLCAQADPAAAARRARQAPWERPVRAAAAPKLRRRRAAGGGAVAEAASGRGPGGRAGDSRRRQTGARRAKPAEQAAPRTPPPSACRLALTEQIAIAPSIPDIHGPGGCGGEDLVRLEAVVLPDKHRVAVTPAGDLALHHGLGDRGLDPHRHGAAGRRPRQQPSAISTISTRIECRGRNRVAGAHLSEHGRANALDVRALKLANGQSIALDRPHGVARIARKRAAFGVRAVLTVLGPGSDWYHEDHIHLDLMERHNNYRICQWNVWDPLPQIAPLLPAERPDEAPPREVAAKSDGRRNRMPPSRTAAATPTPPPTKKRR